MTLIFMIAKRQGTILKNVILTGEPATTSRQRAALLIRLQELLRRASGLRRLIRLQELLPIISKFMLKMLLYTVLALCRITNFHLIISDAVVHRLLVIKVKDSMSP